MKVKSNAAKKTLWILSISRNAIIVVISASIAFYLERTYGDVPFKLSGTVRSGLPEFKVPNFSTNFGNETVSFVDMVSTLGSGVFVVPIVGVLANVAIAKAFGK